MERSSLQDEVFFPSLLWRVDESEGSAATRGVSISVYRNEVLRNIRWLLNASGAPANDPIWSMPEGARSVLNFGLPPFVGKVGDDMDVDEFAAAIRVAILSYEPRILPGTLRVEPHVGNTLQDVGFHIEGNIWCEPVPERFLMEARIDVASGEWGFES